MGKIKDVIVFGFVLFVMFFGVGNLIFLFYLGIIIGLEWLIVFLGFMFVDVGLVFLVVMVIVKFDGNVVEMFKRCGMKLGIFIGCVDILCIGLFLVILRIGVIIYEMGIMFLFGILILVLLFCIFFFVILYVLIIRFFKVVDIVG